MTQGLWEQGRDLLCNLQAVKQGTGSAIDQATQEQGVCVCVCGGGEVNSEGPRLLQFLVEPKPQAQP